jgi:hypothetical protein
MAISIMNDQWTGQEVLAGGLAPASGSLVWSPHDSLFNSSYYSVLLLDASGVPFDQMIVQLLPIPEITISASDSVACAGEDITLIVTPGYTEYIWQDGLNAQQRIPQSTGMYEVTVYDALGCSSTEGIFVTILENELFTANETVLCVPGDQLLANAGYQSYQWSTGYSGPQNTQSIETEGWVVVQAEHDLGCSVTDSIHVSFTGLSTAVLIASDTMCVPGYILADIPSDPGISHVWGNGSTAETHPVLMGLHSYTLTLADQTGCTSILSVDVFGEICTGMPENALSHISLLPNPNDGHFRIHHDQGISSMLIHDVLGRSYWSSDHVAAQESTEVNITNADPGTYFLRIVWENGSFRTIKFSILH